MCWWSVVVRRGISTNGDSTAIIRNSPSTAGWPRRDRGATAGARAGRATSSRRSRSRGRCCRASRGFSSCRDSRCRAASRRKVRTDRTPACCGYRRARRSPAPPFCRRTTDTRTTRRLPRSRMRSPLFAWARPRPACAARSSTSATPGRSRERLARRGDGGGVAAVDVRALVIDNREGAAREEVRVGHAADFAHAQTGPPRAAGDWERRRRASPAPWRNRRRSASRSRSPRTPPCSRVR